MYTDRRTTCLWISCPQFFGYNTVFAKNNGEGRGSSSVRWCWWKWLGRGPPPRLCAAPRVRGRGQPPRWFLARDLEGWLHFLHVFKSKDSDGEVKKQRCCLPLATAHLCHSSLSASAVIILLGSGFTASEESWALIARKGSTGKEILSAVFLAVFSGLACNSGLKGWRKQEPRPAPWQAFEMPGLSPHVEWEVDGHYTFTWPLCTISSGFVLVMSQPEIVYTSCFWFLWSAMLKGCLWARGAGEWLGSALSPVFWPCLFWRFSLLCPDRCLCFCLFHSCKS